LFGRRSNSFWTMVTARVLAQRRELAVLENVRQIREFGPSWARPVELFEELLQRHPLHRLLHGPALTASPWQPHPWHLARRQSVQAIG
jgi:hypothetical protein